MKKLITLSLVLCLSLFGFSQNERINQTAKKDLVSYLDFIPVGFEKQHGFNNRAEFEKATIGSQYEIMAWLQMEVFPLQNFSMSLLRLKVNTERCSPWVK